MDEPVVTPSMLGFPYGSIQDPRMVKIEDTYYVNYALRPSSFGYSPTGVGKPTEHPYDYPGEFGKPEMFLTRSGILKSKDLIHYEQVAYTTPFHINDRDNVYRAGAMMLDLDDPTKVIARPEGFIMEPEEYYEKFGLYIPNVVFPTGNVVKDGLLYIYYGCTDTAISLATVPLKDLVDYVMGR